MKKEKKIEKKAWEKPEIIMLTRGHSEEEILLRPMENCPTTLKTDKCT